MSVGERWHNALAGKEGGVFGRDAWAGMSRAGEADGATGCGGLRAWGRAGLAQAGLARCAHTKSQSMFPLDDAVLG